MDLKDAAAAMEEAYGPLPPALREAGRPRGGPTGDYDTGTGMHVIHEGAFVKSFDPDDLDDEKLD